MIPVNIGYLYVVQVSTLSFYPYAGPAAGLNILANAKCQGGDNGLLHRSASAFLRDLLLMIAIIANSVQSAIT